METKKNEIKNQINVKTRSEFHILILILIIPNIVAMVFFTNSYFTKQHDRELIESMYTIDSNENIFSLNPKENFSIFLTAYYDSPEQLNISITTNRPELNENYNIRLIPDEDSDEYDDSYYSNSEIYYENLSPKVFLSVNVSIRASNQGGYWIIIVKNLMNDWELYYAIGALAWGVFFLYLLILFQIFDKKQVSENQCREFFLVNHDEKYRNIISILPLLTILSWAIVIAVAYLDIINFHADPSLSFDTLYGASFSLSGITVVVFFPIFLYGLIKFFKEDRVMHTIWILYIVSVSVIIVFLNIVFVFSEYYSMTYEELSLFILIPNSFCIFSLIALIVFFVKRDYRNLPNTRRDKN